MDEEWRQIPGYEGAYEVSDCGRVRSVDRIVLTKNGIRLPIRGRERRQHIDKHGYYRVVLSVDGVATNVIVHRAVLAAFKGPPPNDALMACHRDGVRTHNVPPNLYWGTNSANQIDRRSHGTSHVGSRNRKARLTAAQARLIRSLSGQFFLRELAEIFSVNLSTIWDVQNGRSWSYALDSHYES